MSKKIRKLESENEELKCQIIVRKPDLKVEINGSREQLEIPYHEYSTNAIDCEYMKLSMDDVPGEYRSVVTQKALDEYNASLPTEEIIIYSKSEEVVAPKWPAKGKNPIDACYIKDGFYSAGAQMINSMWSGLSGHLDLDSIAQLNSPNRCFYNEDNSFSIRMDDLMNEYTWSTGEKYYIVPKKRGTFDIVCSFVCEEYEKSIEQIIRVVVK